MVETFVGFWSSDPTVMRRLRAMGVLDSEIGKGIRARDARRPHIARELLQRVGANRAKRANVQDDDVAAVLGMLTSFETYDALARAGCGNDEIVATLTRLAQAVAGGKLK
jgi:hypothetical protein